ncbi:10178_t:CDS:2, partial [Scutellospora calospora]
KDIGNKNKVYRIEKGIDQLKEEFFKNNILTLNLPLPRHLNPPLLLMIPLNHYILNELYIMLRIWDQLWELQNHSMQSWFYTPLIGGDKEKDSGNSMNKKSAIFEILSYENHLLYFNQKSDSNRAYKPQYLHFKENIEF